MYLGVGVVLAITIVIMSPLIWIAWWALADMGERATGSYRAVHHVSTSVQRSRAA